MLTVDQHADLSTRLEHLLIAYAPASDKAKATTELRVILAGIEPIEGAENAPADAELAETKRALAEAQDEAGFLRDKLATNVLALETATAALEAQKTDIAALQAQLAAKTTPE